MKTLFTRLILIPLVYLSITGRAQSQSRPNYLPSPFPVISLTSASLSFSGVVNGPALPSQSVGISNAGGGTLVWRAAVTSGSWLGVSPASGTGNGTLTISVNTTGLTAGNYNGAILVVAQDAAPRTIGVSLVSLAANGSYSMPSTGGVSLTTSGAGPLSVGYLHVQPDNGRPAPAGMAIFGYRSGGVLVSEASIPVSELLSSGRTYMELSADGNVNTGIAIANPHDQRATIRFTLTDAGGIDFKTGTANVEGHGQISGFLDEAPYFSGKGVQGTFSFISDVPVSVTAIRGFINERKEFLMTTLPVMDTSRTISEGVQVLSHFAAGNGWTTQVVLLNHTTGPLTGKLEFLNSAGGASPSLVVVNLDGQSTSTANYSIPPGGSSRFIVTSSVPVSGSARILPTGVTAPFLFAVFSYKPGAVTLSEAGTAVTMGRDLRMYVESSDNVSSGIAIANTASTQTMVTLQVTRLSDGAVLAISAPLSLPAYGQLAGSLQSFLPSLPSPMQGVLRFSTTLSSISAIGFRMRYNERGEFLITTTLPTSEVSSIDSTARVVPHFVNGEGFATQFILFSPISFTESGVGSPPPSGALRFFDRLGRILGLDLH